MSRPEYEALYGGAAGGGKSDALVIEALRQVHIPYYKGLILRKTFPQLGELIDKMPPQRRMALSLVLAALFLIDGAYSSKHPNAGKGITDYDNWKQEEMTALPPEQTEDLLPIWK